MFFVVYQAMPPKKPKPPKVVPVKPAPVITPAKKPLVIVKSPARKPATPTPPASPTPPATPAIPATPPVTPPVVPAVVPIAPAVSVGPTAAEMRRRTEDANRAVRNAGLENQIAAQTTQQAAPLGIAQTGSVNLGFGRRYHKVSKKQVGGMKMRGEGVIGYDISGRPIHQPGASMSQPMARKVRKQRGTGFFSAIGDAFRSIPSAFSAIPLGLSGAANNTHEITSRADDLQNMAQHAAPFIGLGRKKKAVRGRGFASQIVAGGQEYVPAVWRSNLRLM